MPTNAPLSKALIDRMERMGNIGHWRWDVNDNKVFWSEGVYHIHGLDFNDYLPNLDATLDAYLPEDRGDVEACLTHAIENQENFTFEKRIKRPDGEIRYVVSHGECEIDEDGNLVALFGIFQDITPIKKQEELYELAALGSNSALWDWDVKDDKLRWAGRSARIIGFALNEQLPQSTKEFFETILHPDDKDTVKNGLLEHFTKLTELCIEVRIKGHNGKYNWFLCRAQAQFNDFGEAIRVCGSMTHIEELKQIQTKLEQSNSDLQNFAAMAAHEIKAPIRSVASYLELIKMKQENLDEELVDYINQSVNIADEMSLMVDELLEYASLQDAKLNLETVSLDQITKLVIRSLKSTIKETGATVTFDTLPEIKADKSKIKTVITNLIQNALKYRSEKAPEIKIEITEDNTHLQYTVKDNGIGMPAEEAEHIFTMFVRLTNVGTTTGTGIGLNICKRIVELHSGKIWAESEVEKGSTFHFTIAKNLSGK